MPVESIWRSAASKGLPTCQKRPSQSEFGLSGGPSFVAVGCVVGGAVAAVSVMTWDEFLDAHPRSHLVVAWLHVRQRTGELRQVRFDLLKRVATALEPGGDWAITDANRRDIHIYRLRESSRRYEIVYVGTRQAPRP